MRKIDDIYTKRIVFKQDFIITTSEHLKVL